MGGYEYGALTQSSPCLFNVRLTQSSTRLFNVRISHKSEPFYSVQTTQCGAMHETSVPQRKVNTSCNDSYHVSVCNEDVHKPRLCCLFYIDNDLQLF